MTRRKVNPTRETPHREFVEPTGAFDLDANLVAKAIDATRLTAPQFARFLVRESRAVNGWLASSYPLPGVVRKRILEILATHPEDRYMEVQAFLARIQRFQRRRPTQRNAVAGPGAGV